RQQRPGRPRIRGPLAVLGETLDVHSHPAVNLGFRGPFHRHQVNDRAAAERTDSQEQDPTGGRVFAHDPALLQHPISGLGSQRGAGSRSHHFAPAWSGAKVSPAGLSAKMAIQRWPGIALTSAASPGGTFRTKDMSPLSDSVNNKAGSFRALVTVKGIVSPVFFV